MSNDASPSPANQDESEAPFPEEAEQEEHQHRVSELFPRSGALQCNVEACSVARDATSCHWCDCGIPHRRNLGSLFSTTPELLRRQRKDADEGVKLQIAGVRDGPDLDLERMKVGMWTAFKLR